MIACLTTPDAFEFFKKFAPQNYINQVCARINIRGDKYRPVKHAENIRCPVLLQICEFDSITPKSAAEETEKNWGNLQKS